MNISKDIDFNALVVLVTLLNEKSATKAAEVLGVSQPTISYAIKKLRKQLGDDLFVYTNKSFIPTNRAKAMHHPLSKAIEVVYQSLTAQSTFSPNDSNKKFRIAISSSGMSFFCQKVVDYLVCSAPNITVDLYPIVSLPGESREFSNRRELLRLIDNGDLDIIIDDNLEGYANLNYRRLYTDEIVMVVSKNNDLVNTWQDVKTNEEVKYVDCLPNNYAHLHEASKLIKKSRIRAYSFGDVVNIIRHSRDFSLIPRYMADFLSKKGILKIVEFEKTPLHYTNYMLWHPKDAGDPCVMWLRNAIRYICESELADNTNIIYPTEVDEEAIA